MEYSKNYTCKQYKTGLFEYDGVNSGDRYAIERNDSMQMEVNLKRRLLVRKSVRWIDSCTYVLTYLSAHDLDGKPVNKDVVEDLHGSQPQEFRIVGGTDEYYVFRGGPYYSDTMRILNKKQQ